MTDPMHAAIYNAVMDIDGAMRDAVRGGVYDAVYAALYLPVDRATAAALDPMVRPAVVDAVYAGVAVVRNLTQQPRRTP